MSSSNKSAQAKAIRHVSYIVFDKNGFVKGTKNPPSLDRGQIAVKLNAFIPRSAFEDGFQVVNLHLPQSQLARVEIQVDSPPPNTVVALDNLTQED